jgi:hypothetical protein
MSAPRTEVARLYDVFTQHRYSHTLRRCMCGWRGDDHIEHVAEAAAGPRESSGPEAEPLPLSKYPSFGEQWAERRPAEAAAGPEPESPASAWLEGYRQGRIEAEAAAGPDSPLTPWDQGYVQAIRDADSDLADVVSDALAAATLGTDYAEAPAPSDEPGSPYVLRLASELAARGARVFR